MKYLGVWLIFAPAAILGLFDVVKASIAGNILLVTGLSVPVSGINNGTRWFERTQGGANAVQSILSVLAWMFPSLYFFAHTESTSPVEYLSIRASFACRRSIDLAREGRAPNAWQLKPPFRFCREKLCPKL